MKVSPNEAKEALEIADGAVLQVKQAIDRQSSRIVLMWGVVYVLVPLSMNFFPVFGVIFQQLLIIGAIAFTIYDTKRNMLVTGPNSWRIGSLWGLTFGFGWVWFFILAPASFEDFVANHIFISRQMWAYGVSLAMFVYVIMGLWIGRIYVVTGLLVTLTTLIGLLFLGDWYWLWCSVTGGGTLTLAGIYIRRQSRL